MKKLIVFFYLVPAVFFAQTQKPQKGKKGPVVDLGTLDIEGEARQPNLQYIEGPAIRDQILKKIFNNSVRKIETELLTPAKLEDFPDLKGKLK